MMTDSYVMPKKSQPIKGCGSHIEGLMNAHLHMTFAIIIILLPIKYQQNGVGRNESNNKLIRF